VGVVIVKSVKPGRGPSMMGVFGGVIAIIFGIFWTVTASSMGAPLMFPIFGILFIAAAIANTIYNYKNATGKNRMSLYDITDEDEESDPLNKYVKYDRDEADFSREISDDKDHMKFCPYCGELLKIGYVYCPKCGKKIG